MRQILINGAVGGIMGYAMGELAKCGHPGLGGLTLLGWLIGMMNSLIPDRKQRPNQFPTNKHDNENL